MKATLLNSLGKQVNFFLVPEDLQLVEKAARSAGPLAVLPDVVSEPGIKELPSIHLPVERMAKERLRVYLTRPEFLSQIAFRHVPVQGYYIVEPGSPVIELDRCFFDGEKLRHGRMYFYTAQGSDPDFLHWGDRVLKATRKALLRSPESRTDFFGPAAMRWMKETNATVHPSVAVIAGLQGR